MSCSRERIADLVDGRLTAGAAEVVLAHAAACDECREELRFVRGLRGRLADADVPRADDTLTQRLSLMPITAPLPVLTGASTPGRGRSRAVRSGAALAGGAVLVAVAAAWVGVDAHSGMGAPTVVPAVDRYAAEHAASTDGLPLNAPGGDAVRTAVRLGSPSP